MRTRTGENERTNRTRERALVARIRSRAAQSAGGDLRLGIGDDCALLHARRGEELAVTTDLSIAGRHFRLDWHSPESIGHRTLARGLSDLASMGARPVAAFLSLGLPRELAVAAGGRAWSTSWLGRFFDGLMALAEAHNVPLAGGDLAQSPVAVADIVLVGAVPRGRALLRSGARAGDAVYVTGSLGGAAAGLAQLEKLAKNSKHPPSIAKKWQSLLAPHLAPQPRIAQGLWLLRRRLATAAIDVSDGLSTDLAHLCEESGVAAEVDAAALPVFTGASLFSRVTLAQALHGGEDYELLFTSSPDARLPRAIAGVPVTRIGRITPRRAGRPAVTLITDAGPALLRPLGWEHFK